MCRNYKSSKLQNLMVSYYSETYFLQKMFYGKVSGPSPILKKLDFFREIQNSVAPLIMATDNIFTEPFLFLKSRSTSRLFSFTIGGWTKYNEILHFSICNTMKTVNYKGASNSALVLQTWYFTAVLFPFGSTILTLAGYVFGTLQRITDCVNEKRQFDEILV